MCHGILLSRPITRFWAIAAISIISILCTFGGITEKDIVFAYLLINNTSNIRMIHPFYKQPYGGIPG